MDGTSSTAAQCNEVDAALSRAVAESWGEKQVNRQSYRTAHIEGESTATVPSGIAIEMVISLKNEYERSANGNEPRAGRTPCGAFPDAFQNEDELGWAGAAGPLTVWGLNISDRGAAFVSEQPLPLRANIHLELPNSRATASGTVRNCMRWGAAWRVGVEFDAAFSKVA